MRIVVPRHRTPARLLRRWTLVLAASAALAGAEAAAVRAQTTADFLSESLEPVFFTPPENVELLTLENGLPVVLMRNPAQPMVGIYVQVAVGSAHEDFRTSGTSHMLEHLLFNGTQKYTQEELYAQADLAGAYNNANTSDYYTNFMMVLPGGELEVGMDLQSQMLFHSVLPPEKFAKEQGIVLGELVSDRDRPGAYTDTVLREALYAGSELALPTLGTRATIANLRRDDVYDFYKAWYVPNNMVLTLAGNFERDEALALLDEYYGTVPPGTLRRDQVRPPAPIVGTASVVRRGGSERVCTLAFEAPGYRGADYFPFLVATELLDATGTGILTRAVANFEVDAQPRLSTWWQKGSDFGRLVLRFDLPPEFDPARCYALVQDAVAAALDRGITAADVAEVVAMETTETLLQREQLRMTGIYAAESLVLGGPDFFASYLPRLAAVEPEEVARALGTRMIDMPCLAVLVEPARTAEEGAGGGDVGGQSGHGMPAGMTLPEGTPMPAAMAEALRKMRAGGGEESGAPANEEDRDEATAGPSAQANAGGAGTMPASLSVERTVLDDGAVLVSQTNPASPIMAVHLTIRGRAMLDREYAVPGAVNIAHRLLTAGIAGCDEACLAHRLRSLGAQIKLVDDARIPMDDYYTTGRFSFVRVEVAAEKGPELLELLVEMTQRASFTAADFERERGAQLALAQAEQSSARARANRLLDERLYGDHPLVQAPEGTVASLHELTLDQVRAVYRKAFAPENLVVAVVSPLTHADLIAELEALLPGRGEPSPGLPPLPLTTASARTVEEQGGEVTAVRMGSVLEAAPGDRTALAILTAILSDRLAMDLRESRGLSYRVGASVAVHGDRAELRAWIDPPTERASEGEQALREALLGFDPATIDQAELDRVRAARKGRAMMRRLSSIAQAYYLAMAELEGDLSRYLEALTAYDRVELTDLRRVHARYLARPALVTVVVN